MHQTHAQRHARPALAAAKALPSNLLASCRIVLPKLAVPPPLDECRRAPFQPPDLCPPPGRVPELPINLRAGADSWCKAQSGGRRSHPPQKEREAFLPCMLCASCFGEDGRAAWRVEALFKQTGAEPCVGQCKGSRSAELSSWDLLAVLLRLLSVEPFLNRRPP